MKDKPTVSINNTYEEIYREHEIYIEPNRDSYLEGFEWSVCKDEIELATGLAFSIADSLEEARKTVDRVMKASNNI